jgi:hypothetical protein
MKQVITRPIVLYLPAFIYFDFSHKVYYKGL